MEIPTYYCKKCKKFKDVTEIVPIEKGKVKCVDCKSEVYLSVDLIEELLARDWRY